MEPLKLLLLRSSNSKFLKSLSSEMGSSKYNNDIITAIINGPNKTYIIKKLVMLELVTKRRNIPLIGKGPYMELLRKNRVVSDVAASRKGKMLLSNTFKEKSRTSKFLNFLRLL